MKKYYTLFEVLWQNEFVYRLNFALWRLRTVMQLLLIYFVWWSVFKDNLSVFGYTQSTILTYIIVSSLIRAIILSSRAGGIASQINDGSFANFLVKPFGILRYYLVQDIADKLLNISFVVFEILALIFLLKPPVMFQFDYQILALFFISIVLGITLFFEITLIIGLTAFWLENVVWGPQFLLVILLEGLGGGLFPIDILPKGLANFLMLTPFPYLIYFPSKLYLGQLSMGEITNSFLILGLWVILLWFMLKMVLRNGLRYYTAVGH